LPRHFAHGNCMIGVTMVSSAGGSETASWNDISEKASAIVTECVSRPGIFRRVVRQNPGDTIRFLSRCSTTQPISPSWSPSMTSCNREIRWGRPRPRSGRVGNNALGSPLWGESLNDRRGAGESGRHYLLLYLDKQWKTTLCPVHHVLKLGKYSGLELHRS
jgi:hypothetical protein